MLNKYILIVLLGKIVIVLLIVDELGEWVIYCYLFYYMSLGMMNKLIVVNVSDS